MDPSQTSIKLVAEEELTNKQRKRFLVVTLDVAKSLCQSLSGEQKRDKYFWNHASLKLQDQAIREVKARLAEDNFAVAEDTIGHRIQNAMKSSQRRGKKTVSESTTTSPPTPGTESRSYDPIRDV